MTMKIKLSDHFTYPRLLRFTMPSVAMMIFTSIYGMVDGVFVSNFVGKTAFSAVNLIMPYLMVFGVLGFMLGTGGTALISMTLGMGDRKRANEYFSLFTYICIGGGVMLTGVGWLCLEPVARLLGAEGQILTDCVVYAKIVLVSTTAYILQFAFQSFCVAAEKPNLSLAMMVVAGVCNIILDALFVAAFEWGLEGAAWATALAQIIGAVIPVVYFARPNPTVLRLGKCRFDGKALLRASANGSSELMSNLSMNLVSMLYNYQLIRWAGEDGIAAYGVIMYVNFIFISVFIGMAIGTAPIFGYHHGAQNHGELKSMFRKSLVVFAILSLAMLGAAEGLADPLSELFVGYDPTLKAMTVRGFRIFSLSFLVCGFSIFGSSLFTAFNNGLVSAIISFVRTLVLQTIAVLLLPLIWGMVGIWWSIVVAEAIAALLTFGCFLGFRKRYYYA